MTEKNTIRFLLYSKNSYFFVIGKNAHLLEKVKFYKRYCVTCNWSNRVCSKYSLFIFLRVWATLAILGEHKEESTGFGILSFYPALRLGLLSRKTWIAVKDDSRYMDLLNRYNKGRIIHR